MSLDRFYTPFDEGKKYLLLEGPVTHHILHVKRLGIGDRIILFNGKGDDCDAEIVEIDQNNVKVRIGNVKRNNNENPVDISIAFAIPKGKRSNFLIQKCSELGVQKLIPLHFERSIVKVKDGKSEKIEKWQKIAIEASRQCERNVITEIRDVMNFADILKNINNYGLPLLANNQSDSDNLKNVLQKAQQVNSLIAFIGPEGGFTSREIEMAKEAGCKFVNISKQTLRIETAAIAFSAVLSYHYSA